MDKKEISVFMTVRNGEDFLANCIKSIDNQTKKPIEVVIVDDGSTDNTIALIEQLAKKQLQESI